MMDRRNFLKATGITLAGLIAAGMVLPLVAKAQGLVAKPRKQRLRPPERPPIAYQYIRPIQWTYHEDGDIYAKMWGYDKDTYELKFIHMALPGSQFISYTATDGGKSVDSAEYLKRRMAIDAAKRLETDNCIVLTKYIEDTP